MQRYFLFFTTLLALFISTNVLSASENKNAVVIPGVTSIESEANQILLPANFPIFTNGKTVVNHPGQGFTQASLPTNNDYDKIPGCYLACYSHSPTAAVYPVSNDIFVYGQVRVPGKYQGRICKPTGFENKDVSAETTFKDLCTSKISTCANAQCWAGGDTGGWFGIQ